jgi:hypothetical protein
MKVIIFLKGNTKFSKGEFWLNKDGHLEGYAKIFTEVYM